MRPSFLPLLILYFCLVLFFQNAAQAAGNANAGIPIDPESSPPLRHQIGAKFSWGAKVNIDSRFRDNRDLRNRRDDGDARTKGELTLATQYLPQTARLPSGLAFFAEMGFERVLRHKEGRGKTSDETRLNFKKGYLNWPNFLNTPLRLQVGRQRFKDRREWVYDDILDAFRIFYNKDRLELQFSYSSNLFDPEHAEDRIKNLMLFGIYDVWAEDKINVYLINRRGQFNAADPDFNLNFLGISLHGKSLKRQRYWIESALVKGDEKGKDVSGYGFDLGWITRFKHPDKPALTLAYAFGSGDANPDNQRDTNFRQTGFQDNDAKLRGVTKIKQYGELFEPELSNMMIMTLGFGLRPVKHTSLDIVYHRYTQVWAYETGNNTLRDVGIKESPNGKSRDLGEEIDLVFGWKAGRRLRFEWLAAFFLPGAAFDNTDPAFLGKLKISFIL